jgi:hypothetical protein
MLKQSMPKTNPPISEKRRAANRANATHSTGPRTPEGKTRSAQNARKHGFTASLFAVVRLEELDALTNLRADAIGVYQPVNSQELFAVERIALSQQALLRCATLEAGMHTSAMNETVTPGGLPANILSQELTADIEVTRAQNRSLCLAIGFQRISGKSDAWKLFLRYQAQTERLYRRAIEEFDRLKALRTDLPNEPIADPDPEEILPTEAPSDRHRASLFDPTIAVTSPIPPSFPKEKSPSERGTRTNTGPGH